MSAKKIPFEKLIKDNGEFIRPINGVSMLPLLRQEKDAVHLKSANRELEAGEVALYKRPSGQYVLHRVAKVRSSRYIIRGDNCFGFESVPKKWVIAFADCFYRDGEPLSCSDPEYRLYTDKVLKLGRPFTRTEYDDFCRTNSITRLLTVLPENSGVCPSHGRGLGYIFKRIFPPFSFMKLKYPILDRLPLLLPIMWIVRIFGCVFSWTRLKYAAISAWAALRKK